MRPAVRDLLVAVSLANLSFISVWDEVLAVTRNRYLLDVATADAVALMLDVLLLGLVFTAGAALSRRLPGIWPRRVGRAGFLAVLVLLCGRVVVDLRLTGFEHLLVNLFGDPSAVRARQLAPLLPVLVFATWPVVSSRVAQRVLLFFFPMTLVTFGRAGWSAATGDLTRRYADRPLAVVQQAPVPVRRVVLVILDELDQRFAFSGRDASLLLPAFDRLRDEAVFTTQAIAPSLRTHVSVPAMLAGRAVDATTYDAADTLMVRFAGDTAPVSWNAAPNVLEWAYGAGLNPAVAGSTHPYCRVLHRMVTRCLWRPVIPTILRDRTGFVARMAGIARSVDPWDEPRRHREDYQALLAAGKAIAADSTIGFALVHLNVPHPPPIYDRRSATFSGRTRPALEGYLDNLALADRALGELRDTMEAAGVWERTAVIVASDHPYRWHLAPDARLVPLLVRVPGSGSGVEFDEPVAGTVVAEIGRAFLRSEVTTGEDVVRLLQAWGAAGAPVPVH